MKLDTRTALSCNFYLTSIIAEDLGRSITLGEIATHYWKGAYVYVGKEIFKKEYGILVEQYC